MTERAVTYDPKTDTYWFDWERLDYENNVIPYENGWLWAPINMSDVMTYDEYRATWRLKTLCGDSNWRDNFLLRMYHEGKSDA